MNLKNFTEGVAILSPHYSNPAGYHLGAEHDQIYLYATDTPLSEEEVTQLRELDWFQPEAGDGDDYDPQDGWSAFV